MTFLSITARLSIECVFIAFGHLNAALLITSGVDVKTVQTCLGHSEATTTVNNVKGHKNQSSYITIKSVTFKGNTLTFITTNNCMTCTLIFLKYKR